MVSGIAVGERPLESWQLASGKTLVACTFVSLPEVPVVAYEVVAASSSLVNTSVAGNAALGYRMRLCLGVARSDHVARGCNNRKMVGP